MPRSTFKPPFSAVLFRVPESCGLRDTLLTALPLSIEYFSRQFPVLLFRVRPPPFLYCFSIVSSSTICSLPCLPTVSLSIYHIPIGILSFLLPSPIKTGLDIYVLDAALLSPYRHLYIYHKIFPITHTHTRAHLHKIVSASANDAHLNPGRRSYCFLRHAHG